MYTIWGHLHEEREPTICVLMAVVPETDPAYRGCPSQEKGAIGVRGEGWLVDELDQ